MWFSQSESVSDLVLLSQVQWLLCANQSSKYTMTILADFHYSIWAIRTAVPAWNLASSKLAGSRSTPICPGSSVKPWISAGDSGEKVRSRVATPNPTTKLMLVLNGIRVIVAVTCEVRIWAVSRPKTYSLVLGHGWSCDGLVMVRTVCYLNTNDLLRLFSIMIVLCLDTSRLTKSRNKQKYYN